MKKYSPSQSAFFNPRISVGFVLCLTGVCIVFVGLGESRPSDAAPARPGANVTRPDAAKTRDPFVGVSTRNDVSPPLREMPQLPIRQMSGSAMRKLFSTQR